MFSNVNLNAAAQWQKTARHTALRLASFCFVLIFLQLVSAFLIFVNQGFSYLKSRIQMMEIRGNRACYVEKGIADP